MAGQTPALQQNFQSSEKSQNFKEKHNIKWIPFTYMFQKLETKVWKDMKEIEREKRDLLIKRKTIKDAADNFLFSTLIRIEAIYTDYFVIRLYKWNSNPISLWI